MTKKETENANILSKVFSAVTASERSVRIFHCLLLVIICVLVYSNVCDGDFVHDDIPAIVNNDDSLGKSNIFEVLSNDYWGMNIRDRRSHKSYRPLTILTFRLVYIQYLTN